MKHQSETLPNSRVELTVQLSAEEYEQFEEQAAKEISEEVEIEGFRKGSAPASAVKQKVGEDRVRQEALEKAVQSAYSEAVSEEDIEPIAQPEVQLDKQPDEEDKSVRFTARVAVLPDISLPDYKDVASSTERREVEVTDEEVQETLEQLQKSRASSKQVLRAAQEGDYVQVEFSSPQLQEGAPQQDAFVLGEGQLLPGFQEALTGMSAGEETEFTTQIPEEHHVQELAGQEVTFNVKMSQVNEVETPEINDELAKEVGDFDSLDRLKENIREGMKAEKEAKESQRLRQEILENIAEQAEMEVPDVLVEREKERMLDEMKQNVQQQLGVSFDQYLEQVQKNEEQLKEEIADQAQQRVKNFLALRAIADEEQIQPSDEEIEEEVNNILKQYGDVEEAKKQVDPEQVKEYARETLVNEKTLQVLEEQATN